MIWIPFVASAQYLITCCSAAVGSRERSIESILDGELVLFNSRRVASVIELAGMRYSIRV